MKYKNQMILNKTQILKSSFLSCKYLSSGPTASPVSWTCDVLQSPDFFHRPVLEDVQIHGLDVSSLNSMIAKFSKDGDLNSACHLFKQMPQRDVVSWNSLMSAYSQDDQPREVVRLFSEMKSHGLKPTSTSFSVILSACAKLGALNHGEWIHGLSIKDGFHKNVFVGTSLITMYSKCKRVDCLLRVFDSINLPNLAAQNALISGFVANRQIENACGVFDRMMDRNVISWTALMSGYIEVKKIGHAYELFNAMPGKNSVSWSVMLGGFVYDRQFEKAIEFFNEMRNNVVRATAACVTHLIIACSESKNLEQGRNVHGYVIKAGYDFDGVVEASLVFMYVKCLNIEEARLEFNRMEHKFVGSWNTLICGYVDNSQVDEARRLFDKMDERDYVSWNSMIKAYLGCNKIDDAVELFMKMPKPTIEARTSVMSGFMENGRIEDARRLFNETRQRDVIMYTTMISGFVKEGMLVDAWELFKMMPNRNVVSYNVMISGLVQHGMGREAYELFNEAPERDVISWNAIIKGHAQSGFSDKAFHMYQQMILSDVRPTESVICSLLTACANLSLLSNGEQVHASAIKLGFEWFLLITNSLINMYGKCGHMLKARVVFDDHPEHDIVTWNGIIYGYAINGLTVEATKMFENMKMTGIQPDGFTFYGILTACTHGGLVEESWCYFNSMKCVHGIIPTLAHYACLIDLLCRKGLVEKAEKLICSMPVQPDSAIWTSLLCGCKLNTNIEIAKWAAKQLFALNARDTMPYLQLIRIYGLAGRRIDVENLRMKMNKLGLKKRPGCSWIEINGEVNSFFAGDRSHSLYLEVQTCLRKLMSEIKKLGYMPNYYLVMEDMEDQEKEEILIQHSEKLAVAFGLLQTAPPKPLRIIKNLQTCADCHSAFKLISLCSKREIVMRDAVRFHHFKGGSCSCSDYW